MTNEIDNFRGVLESVTDSTANNETKGASDADLIAKMAKVMASSIVKLLEPCVEQRCKQFLTLMNEGGMFDEKEPTHD